MWKFVSILLLAIVVVQAEEETPQKGPQSSFIQAVLCYASSEPWNCVKEQAGRLLSNWEETVEEKRHELMVEADEEMKESETSRGLTDDEKKQQPSEILSTLDKGFSAMANLITDEIDTFRGRDSRAVKQTSKDVIDDVSNDFNDDDEYSVLDALRQNEAEGKGKKGKKGKKGLMKMFFLGAIIKSKIELLLKILSFHLQLKFFAIALVGLVINLARFWIDLKKHPQKHHYDDHDDWGSSWKRQTQNQEYQQPDNFAHRLAYNSAAPYQR